MMAAAEQSQALRRAEDFRSGSRCCAAVCCGSASRPQVAIFRTQSARMNDGNASEPYPVCRGSFKAIHLNRIMPPEKVKFLTFLIRSHPHPIGLVQAHFERQFRHTSCTTEMAIHWWNLLDTLIHHWSPLPLGTATTSCWAGFSCFKERHAQVERSATPISCTAKHTVKGWICAEFRW